MRAPPSHTVHHPSLKRDALEDGVSGPRFAFVGEAKWIPAFAAMTSMGE
jgi:hypothetical protein